MPIPGGVPPHVRDGEQVPVPPIPVREPHHAVLRRHDRTTEVRGQIDPFVELLPPRAVPAADEPVLHRTLEPPFGVSKAQAGLRFVPGESKRQLQAVLLHDDRICGLVFLLVLVSIRHPRAPRRHGAFFSEQMPGCSPVPRPDVIGFGYVVALLAQPACRNGNQQSLPCRQFIAGHFVEVLQLDDVDSIPVCNLVECVSSKDLGLSRREHAPVCRGRP
mmetsp:Transcript_21288/g.35673  ORF Transcript_21288/g.35673 Transcript_21288/m.35673 type:complete len:218 (+) Transcript_21288:340-993(+)